jgi:N-acetylglucosamine-6-sulfatase
MNGVNLMNWDIPPAGWDHIEYLMEPYQTTPNNVVMSINGEHPLSYHGYHQTDIIRAKALSRLQTLIDGDEPFFLFLSPTAPHADDETQMTVPCQRHMDLFLNVSAPRLPNFNPSDDVQSNVGGWLKNIPAMNDGNITWADSEHRRRIQALQGIDEMLADLLETLAENDVLDNTYGMLGH